MAIRVEHELHQRRRGRNLGVLIALLVFVAIVFGLTVVKVRQLGDANAFQGYDHVVQPGLAAIAGDDAPGQAATGQDVAPAPEDAPEEDP